MITYTKSHRLDEIRNIQREYKRLYQLGAGLLIFLIGIWIGSPIFAHDNGYATNIFTEVLSIFATIVIIDRLNEHRQQQRETRLLQKQLIMDAGSRSNEKALDAITQLQIHGWLNGEKGVLMGEKLWLANLQDAKIVQANLAKADLRYASFESADLLGANLESARWVGQS